MISNPLAELLIEAGFTDGWAICDDVLVVWEHDADPPAPLVRPEQSDNE